MLKKILFGLTLLSAVLFFNFAFATPNSILKVGVTNDYPFSSFNKNGASGLTVDLWKAIAAKNHWRYKFVSVNTTINKAINDLAAGKYSVLVGPISTTEQREKLVDFSRPYYVSNTGIILKKDDSPWQLLSKVFKDVVTHVLLLFVLISLIFAYFFWLIEHKQIAENGSQKTSTGVVGVLWHIMYHFLKGGPLPVPKTSKGKIILVAWLLLALFFMLSISAIFTSKLTVYFEKGSDFANLAQLENVALATISGTTGIGEGSAVDAKIIPVKNLAAGIALLDANKVKGVIEDYLVADHFLANHSDAKLYISKITLGYDELAFAIAPQHSKLREKIDQSILDLQEIGQAKHICQGYIGSKAAYCDL